jgi:hypothetical protein
MEMEIFPIICIKKATDSFPGVVNYATKIKTGYGSWVIGFGL